MNVSVAQGGPAAALPPSQARREESLTCNSCRKNFDAHRRRPLSLQCCHSYCETCVTGMTTGKHGKKITCAQCKKTTKIDNSCGGNGSVLPVNYAILKMVSVNNQTVPGSVTVTGNCDSPGLVRSAFEQVTVIPVNSGDVPRQVQCKENRPTCQTTPPADRSRRQHDARMTSPDMSNQCPGTISISIGELNPTKNCAKPEKPTSSSEIANAHASSTTCVTVTSLTNGFPSCPPPHSQAPCQHAVPSVGPTVVPNFGPTVTSLTVKTPGSSSSSHPAPSCQQPSAPVDLCSQCCVNQAAVTVTSAARMSSQKLCTGCYALVQSRAEEEQLVEVQNRNNPAPCGGRRGVNQPCASDGPPTTVIKVSDENSTTPCPVFEPPNKCEPTACLLAPMIPNDDGCIHVDRIRVPSAKRPADVKNKWVAREESPAVAEGVTKEECPCKQAPVVNKLAYQACSKFDLGSIRKSEKPVSVKSSTECCPINEKSGAVVPEEIPNEPEYRPLPYNPHFAGSDAPPPLEPLQPEAPTLDPIYPPLLNPTLSSGAYNEKQPLVDYQPPVPQYPLLPGAPPSYEEIAGQHAKRDAPSATVRLVHSFGKYGEIATQPGAFRSPGRVNVSRSGIAVVSDSVHRTVQAFSPNGECLSLIRVAGDAVGGCSCYENNKLAVGTNTGVQIYDFNGLLKKTIPVGQVINTVATGASGFIAVQPKALHVFRGPNETLFRTLRGRSKPGPTQQSIPFDCIADAAVNSQQDVVVLDAGAASGLGSIFVLSEDGFLKTCIVPGREPCGVLRRPSAVAVDGDHGVVVSDSANGRVLLFGANGRFRRQLLGPGQIGSERQQQQQAYPVGLDVTEDGRLFVVAKGDKYAEVRIFTYL